MSTFSEHLTVDHRYLSTHIKQQILVCVSMLTLLFLQKELLILQFYSIKRNKLSSKFHVLSTLTNKRTITANPRRPNHHQIVQTPKGKKLKTIHINKLEFLGATYRGKRPWGCPSESRWRRGGWARRRPATTARARCRWRRSPRWPDRRSASASASSPSTASSAGPRHRPSSRSSSPWPSPSKSAALSLSPRLRKT